MHKIVVATDFAEESRSAFAAALESARGRSRRRGPPLDRGGLEVGDHLRIELPDTCVERGFIDFRRSSG